MSVFIIPRVLGAILLSTCFVKSVRNTHRTHAEYDWSVYLLAFCLICKFHLFWRSNRCMFRKRRMKILACSLKRSVTLLENDSTCFYDLRCRSRVVGFRTSNPSECEAIALTERSTRHRQGFLLITKKNIFFDLKF